MKMTITTKTEIEVDLKARKFADWPKEAQDCARMLLGWPQLYRKFERLGTKEEKLEWLVSRVEEWLEQEPPDLFGL